MIILPNQHVTHNSDGTWNVQPENGKRASGIFDTQREAIAKATEHAKNQGTELFIHGKDNKIRERNSFGNDPYPPKG